MNNYRIAYRCKNGFEGEEIVNAANRTMAFEIFAKFEYFKDVVALQRLTSELKKQKNVEKDAVTLYAMAVMTMSMC